MDPWTRPTGRTPYEVVVIGPDRCPNGHPFTPPNVLIGSNVDEIWYECQTCRLTIHRPHDERRQWVTVNATLKTVVEVEGFDPHPLRPEDTMLSDR